MGKWLAEFQENTLEMPTNCTDNTDRSIKKPDLSVMSVHQQSVLPELMAIVSKACDGLTITPQQFIALLTEEDKQDILSGGTQGDCLRCYAESFSEGIKTGRILFHPTTGFLIKHGVN